MKKPPRVAILHQGCIPWYRKKFYERLNVKLLGELSVVAGSNLPGYSIKEATGPFDFDIVNTKNLSLHVFGRIVVIQPSAVRLLRRQIDVFVFGHEFKYLTNWLLLLYAKIAKKTVIFWGFGYHKKSDSRFAQRLSLSAARCANGYLAYTEGGRNNLIARGFDEGRVFSVQNTIDVEEERRTAALVSELERERLKSELGITANSIIFCMLGRLAEKKRPLDFFEFLNGVRQQVEVPIWGFVIGTGPMFKTMESLCKNDSNIMMFGYVEGRRFAELLTIADVLVSPGSVGLNVVQGFAYSLPHITRRDVEHSPEVEYLIDDANSKIAGGMAEMIDHGVRCVNDTSFRSRLKGGALASIERFSVEAMADKFSDAIVRIYTARQKKINRTAKKIDGT